MRRHLTEEEQILIARLREYLLEPSGMDGISTMRLPGSSVQPPLSPQVLEEAERDLGFALPPLLRELYLQVGNGGFGPGSGLFRLTGHPKDDEAIVSTYKMSTGPDVPEEYNSWHPRHILVFHWGCNIYSVVDCTTTDGSVYRYWLDRYNAERDGPLHAFGILEADSLREWLELWLAGEDLGGEYGQPRQT